MTKVKSKMKNKYLLNVILLAISVIPLSLVTKVSAQNVEKTQVLPKSSLFGDAPTVPVINEFQEIVANDGVAFQQFGFKVSIDGNTAIVGAERVGNGAAYVFVNNEGIWTQQAKLVASDGANSDFFGSCVSVDGDTAVVGAVRDSHSGLNMPGSAYVFTRTGETWTEQTKLTASDAADNDRFGLGCSIDDDTAIIGANLNDNNGFNNNGAAYIYNRSGTAWSEQTKLVGTSPRDNGTFGWSVDIDAGRVIIGATGEHAAYLYRFANGNWEFDGRLVGNDTVSGDIFGESVAIKGNNAIVGAERVDLNGQTEVGAAYVFVRGPSVWTQQGKLTPPDGQTNDLFGKSVAIDGDFAVVGSLFHDANGLGLSGAAYGFQRIGSNWVQTYKLLHSEVESGDALGISVALQGRTALVGSRWRDVVSEALVKNVSQNLVGGTNVDQGAGYFFEIPFLPQKTPFDFDGDGRTDFSVFRPSTGDWYVDRSTNGLVGINWGLSTDILTPADFDGDGKDDFAVWRPDAPEVAAFYILSSSDFTTRIETFGQTGDNPLVVGDWDGDGIDDPAVYRDSAVGSQSFFYFLGSDNNPSNNITFLPWGTTGDEPIRGDFDGDRKKDLAVFRPSTEQWIIRQSSDANVRYERFGFASDRRFDADFDGDGKTDLTAFRPSENNWYYLRSIDNEPIKFTFGLSTDQLVPGDYDGDGKTDIAVFRDGVWYITDSSSGSLRFEYFGVTTDIAVPSSIVSN